MCKPTKIRDWFLVNSHPERSFFFSSILIERGLFGRISLLIGKAFVVCEEEFAFQASFPAFLSFVRNNTLCVVNVALSSELDAILRSCRGQVFEDPRGVWGNAEHQSKFASFYAMHRCTSRSRLSTLSTFLLALSWQRERFSLRGRYSLQSTFGRLS